MWKNNTTFFTSLIFGLCEHQSLWRLFTRQVGARIFWKFSPRKLRSGWCLHFNSTLSTLFLNSSAVRSAVGAPMCEMKWSSQKFHCPVWSKIPDISTETGHSMFPIVFIWTLDDHRTSEITKITTRAQKRILVRSSRDELCPPLPRLPMEFVVQ